MKGVMPAPPAKKIPGPLYSMAPHTSLTINSSPIFKFPNALVTPSWSV